MVSKENYEIWMMDYLDGNLSEPDQKLLLQFLDENPHLKEELEGLDNVVLSPEDASFMDKDALLKTHADKLDLSYPDYVAIKEVEEGLNEEEAVWKSSYLKEDESRSKLFVLYTKTILKADHAIKYNFKGNLKRAVLVPVLKLNTVKRMAVAASLALLLSVGTLPFLKDTAIDIQTVVVNDTPSLISMPKKQDVKVDTHKASEDKVENKKLIPLKNQVTQHMLTGQPKTNIAFNADPISPMGIKPFKTRKVNAYELGLNAMMPIIIANNISESEEEYLAMQSQVEEESNRLSRSAKAFASGVKVINFLSGNETKMKKILNQDGQMVAYQLESDNISIRQRIKTKPVTN